MNVVWVLGGLGNQLFQYALYSRLKTTNNNTKIDISNFDSYNLHNGFELARVFDLDIDYASETDLDFYKPDSIFSRVTFKVSAPLVLIFDFQISRLNMKVIEHHNPIKNIKFLNFQNKYFYGQWQKELYLEKDRDKLLQLIKFKSSLLELDKKNLNIYKMITRDDSLCIHVRGGDYLSRWRLSKDYYTNAVDFVKSIQPIKKIIVFSDDDERVQSIFKGVDYELVRNNIGLMSYLDMYLMSRAKNLIIANSSFSWWSAYLNTSHNIIVAPYKWLDFEYKILKLIKITKDYKPLYLKDWKEI